MMTAFGSSVVPEENCRNAGLSGSTSTGVHSWPPACSLSASTTVQNDATDCASGPMQHADQAVGHQNFGVDLFEHPLRSREVLIQLAKLNRRIQRRRDAAGENHAEKAVEELDAGGQDHRGAIAAFEAPRLKRTGAGLGPRQDVFIRVEDRFARSLDEPRALPLADVELQHCVVDCAVVSSRDPMAR